MISEGKHRMLRRKKASQINGKKGGVKSEEGKTVSSQNAIKHGVLSNSLSEYDRLSSSILYKELADEFSVKTLHQKMLLEQLVLCYIKLARCSRFESEIMRESLSAESNPSLLDISFENKIIPDDAKAIIDEQTFKRLELVLTRYEPQLVNRLINLIGLLKSYQRNSSLES